MTLGTAFSASASIVDVLVAKQKGYFDDLCLDVAGKEREGTSVKCVGPGITTHCDEGIGDLAREHRIARIEYRGLLPFRNALRRIALTAMDVADRRDDLGIVRQARSRDLKLA